MANRSVVLDTETTGMPVTDGHRIIEIGCVELIGRRLTGRHFHVYLQPDRESDEGAIGVHGITNEFLVGKPRFAEVADEFFEFIQGAQLIIHNAAFDVGFINNEFALMGQHDRADITRHCTILDTLMMARERHPGQRNSLDALCKRYGVDNSQRIKHGALMDSLLLAEVYIELLGERQATLGLSRNDAAAGARAASSAGRSGAAKVRPEPLPMRLTAAMEAAHRAFVATLGGNPIWERYYGSPTTAADIAPTAKAG